jgi:integrase
VEWDGKPIASIKKSFSSALRLAGLENERICPHTLRHTCVTWLMQAGVSEFEVGGYTGMSPAMIRKVYAHHHPEHLNMARSAMDRLSTATKPPPNGIKNPQS